MAYEFLGALAVSFGAAYLATEGILETCMSMYIYGLRKSLKDGTWTTEDALKSLYHEKAGWSFMPIARIVLSREIRRTENMYKV